jgi:hypothetical protein
LIAFYWLSTKTAENREKMWFLSSLSIDQKPCKTPPKRFKNVKNPKIILNHLYFLSTRSKVLSQAFYAAAGKGAKIHHEIFRRCLG